MATFKYYENDKFNFELDNRDFVTILGSGNRRIVNNLYYLDRNDFVRLNCMCFSGFDKKSLGTRINFVLNDYIDLFLCSKVRDEFLFVLENKGLSRVEATEVISEYSFKFKIRDILECNPVLLDVNNQVKVKFVLALMTDPKVIVISNVLEELDYDDSRVVVRVLKDFVKSGNIVINFTNNIEEALLGNRVILTDMSGVIASGKTLSVLNEERLLKRLGFGQPFIIDLCSFLMDYGLIDKYYVSHRGLVNVIWK